MNSRYSKLGVRTWIEIDEQSLFFNLHYFQKRVKRVSQLMVMVKSNAYGHGLFTIAKLFRREPIWFDVDSITEALALRKRGIKNKILVLGYTLPSRLKDAEQKRISITISSFEALRDFLKLKKRPRFHLKIDTGMHRQGFQEYELIKLIKLIKQYRLKPEGTYSHLAMPQNKVFSKHQASLFEKACSMLNSAGIHPGLKHFNKTKGIIFSPQTNFDMVRLGIGLYGYFSRSAGRGSRLALASAERALQAVRIKLPLRHVMTWKTIVSEVKNIPRGERIGYDLTERVIRNSKIAILPIGYWHGYDRGLSSVGQVLIRGNRAKVLGRVTMDMTIVDVTNIPDVAVGDEVVLIGRQGRASIDANEIGAKLGTTSYEILARVNPLIQKITV